MKYDTHIEDIVWMGTSENAVLCIGDALGNIQMISFPDIINADISRIKVSDRRKILDQSIRQISWHQQQQRLLATDGTDISCLDINGNLAVLAPAPEIYDINTIQWTENQSGKDFQSA